jgi:hypothetical protein
VQQQTKDNGVIFINVEKQVSNRRKWRCSWHIFLSSRIWRKKGIGAACAYAAMAYRGVVDMGGAVMLLLTPLLSPHITFFARAASIS